MLYSKFSGVIELNPKDFKMSKNKSILKNKNFINKPGIIIFYADWCKHCQNSVEMWSDLALEFKNKFPIGAVQCDAKKNEDLCIINKINYYPTIKLVNNKGELFDYKGSSNKDDIIYFICTKI